MKNNWRENVTAWGRSLIFWPLMLLAVVLLYKGEGPPSFNGGNQQDVVLPAPVSSEPMTPVPVPVTETIPITEVKTDSFIPQKAIKPVAGQILRTQGWGRHTVYKDWRLLPGVEMAAQPGETVLSAYAGIVESVSKTKQEGSWLVKVDHGSGWQSEYIGMETVSVQPAQHILAGNPVGKVAGTGDTSVIFILRNNGELVDPVLYLP